VFRAAADAEGSPVRRRPVVLNALADEFSLHDALARHGLALPPEPDSRLDPLDRRRETASGTPLLPDDLVAIALDHHVRSVIRNSAGVVIDYGRKRRLFTGPAREAALLTVQRCSRNGCSVPARHCQVDHLQGWVGGGRTDQDNACPTCQHDNRAKHELGLMVRRTPEGYLNWYRRDGSYLGPVGRRRFPDEYEIECRFRERVADLLAHAPPR
jgi:HNH endonuclease